MNATEAAQAIEANARERFQNDVRFRAIVQGVVARVLSEHGPVNPEKPDRDAHDIAVRVAALVIETMFAEGQELAAQRELAERYRKLAEDALAFSPPRIVAPAPSRE